MEKKELQKKKIVENEIYRRKDKYAERENGREKMKGKNGET